MNFFLLALKNLSRHPSHTALKAFGIGAATAVIALWGMLTGGFAEELERTATKVELGMVQAHHKGFLAAPNIYDRVPFSKDIADQLLAQGLFAAPRLYGFALVGKNDQSVGVKVRGLAPEVERTVTDIHDHLKSGSWLTSTDTRSLILGEKLARMFSVKPGDELILFGQAADGSLANDLFKVQGVLKSINQEIDQRTIIVNETDFREFFVLPDGVHEVAIAPANESLQAKEPQELKQIVLQSIGGRSHNQAVAVAADTLIVRTWREIKPPLARTLGMLKVTSLFSLMFTYIALGCLVVNSIMMMVFDRLHEYGVMKALGTEPSLIIRLVLSESIWLGLLAGVFAAVVTTPFAFFWQKYGLDLSFYIERVSFGGFVIEPRLMAKVGLRQVLLPFVFLMVTMPLAALYPAWKAARVEPIEALNSRT